tara:strand:+ start:3579 stop:4247 length:669 start_codon:yes stop_codon:yes gene_type:complete
MSQTQSNLPVKAAGQDFFSAECNNLTDTINLNATDLAALSAQKDNALAAAPVLSLPLRDDLVLYFDKVAGAIKTCALYQLEAATEVYAYHAGAGSAISTGVSPVALAIFDGAFYSTSASLTDTGDDTGVTTSAALRYEVSATLSITALTSDEFTFRLYAGGVPMGRDVLVSGLGAGNSVNATLKGVSGLLTATDKIELRVSLSGGTITTIAADLTVKLIAIA